MFGVCVFVARQLSSKPFMQTVTNIDSLLFYQIEIRICLSDALIAFGIQNYSFR